MRPIRTAMVTTPSMLRDLIRGMAIGRVELDVVAEFSTRHALARRLEAIAPDLIVIGLRRSETDAVVRRLLMLLPTAKFIAFSGNGRMTVGFELRVYQTDLSDVSPDSFIEFARSSIDKTH